MITQRENALRVLNRSGDPEWVPVSIDAYHTFVPLAIRERPRIGCDGDDWFGCPWTWDAMVGGHGPNLHKPFLLDDVTKWEDVVKFPDLDAIDWKGCAEEDMAGVDRNQKLVRIFWESGPFERAHHILSFEGAFVAMSTEPEAFKAFVDAIADFRIKTLDYLYEYYKPDAIFAHDDLGTAHGPMMSVEMYRELIKPAHKRFSNAIRERGMFHIHHSCGFVEPFIPELIDVGVQVLNSVQSMNDRKKIAETYSDKLVFDVGPDGAVDLPETSEESLRQIIRDIMDTFAPRKNLFVHARCVEPRNGKIILDEARKYGAGFYKKA